MIELDDAHWPLDVLYRSLSGDEQARAERFLVPKDLERYIVGRGWLRSMLAHYLQISAGDVEIRHGPYGKPELASSPRFLQFNVSHSGPRMLAVFSTSYELGADIEQRVTWQADDLRSAGVLSPAEAAHLSLLPSRGRTASFLKYWSRKEAILKAEGTGLMTRALDSVSTESLDRGDQLVDVDNVAFRVIDLVIDDRHSGAVALTPVWPEPQMCFFRFDATARL